MSKAGYCALSVSELDAEGLTDDRWFDIAEGKVVCTRDTWY